MWWPSSQVSMAKRSMNRLWHKMAATAVGSRIQVYRGSWGATGMSVSLSKETGRGAALPSGDSISKAEHLAVNLNLFSPLSHFHGSFLLTVLKSLWHSSVSISALGGIYYPPQACLRLCWDDIHLFQEGVSLFYFSPSLPRLQLTHSCVLTHIKEHEGMNRWEDRVCSYKLLAGMIERAVSVRLVHVQRVNRKQEQCFPLDIAPLASTWG